LPNFQDYISIQIRENANRDSKAALKNVSLLSPALDGFDQLY